MRFARGSFTSIRHPSSLTQQCALRTDRLCRRSRAFFTQNRRPFYHALRVPARRFGESELSARHASTGRGTGDLLGCSQGAICSPAIATGFYASSCASTTRTARPTVRRCLSLSVTSVLPTFDHALEGDSPLHTQSDGAAVPTIENQPNRTSRSSSSWVSTAGSTIFGVTVFSHREPAASTISLAARAHTM